MPEGNIGTGKEAFLKYCECGCGSHLSPIKRNRPIDGYKKGDYPRFISGHNLKKGENGNNTYCSKYGRKLARRKVENILGIKLSSKIVIHHIDGNTSNNENTNLIVCQDDIYHRLLHLRQKAYYDCGNAKHRLCYYCGIYDDINNLYISKNPKHIFHRKCRNNHRPSRKK